MWMSLAAEGNKLRLKALDGLQRSDSAMQGLALSRRALLLTSTSAAPILLSRGLASAAPSTAKPLNYDVGGWLFFVLRARIAKTVIVLCQRA